MTIDCLAHVHSSFSYDSPTDLSEIRSIAISQNIRCVLISEHNNTLDQQKVDRLVSRCDDLSSEACLLIPGLELSLQNNNVHLLAYGVQRYIPSSPSSAFRDLVTQIHDSDGIAVLAHPSHKRALDRLRSPDLAGLDGIEIWNVKNGSRFCPHFDELRAWQRIRRNGLSLAAYAGLDWHHVAHFQRLVLRIEIPALESHHVMSQLRAGSFQIVGPQLAFDQQRGPGFAGRLASLATTRLVIPAGRGTRRAQTWLERRGFQTPAVLSRIGRRFFS